MNLLPELNDYVKGLEANFQDISEKRKKELLEVAEYLSTTLKADNPVNLIFICTHNSRRSHISQLWAQAAAWFYGIENIYCFSGGTEATVFNPRAVKAMHKTGFEITQNDESANPVYMVKYASEAPPLKAFSKKFDDSFNAQTGFAAIMTCSDADEACPIIPGTDKRFSLTYSDPKEADDTPEEEQRYDERCRQIGTEMCFLFSQL